MSKSTTWVVVGVAYCVAYAVVVSALGDDLRARLLIGNAGLLLPPLATLVAVLSRRHEWRGRQRVFWDAIAGWALMWFVSQVFWASDEILRGEPLPWFKWYTVVQLSASALPIIALVARPHRGARVESATTTAIDVWVLDLLTAFLYWTLIIAPGMIPEHSNQAFRTLATIGPLVRLAAVIGLVGAAYAARGTPWRDAYLRLAAGMVLAVAALTVLSYTTADNAYRTGSPTDIGWMLPFWFAAWAAASAPASATERRSFIMESVRLAPATLLFAALAAVPIIGYGVRYLQPLGDPVDRYREFATAVTLAGGLVFTMVRVLVERRTVGQATRRLRLLSAAFEQTEELIVIVSGNAIRYANDACCRAVGYEPEELEHVAPSQLLTVTSLAKTTPLVEGLRRGEVARASVTVVRKDATTFEAACSVARIVGRAGHEPHFVAVARDITEDVALREQFVRSERMSAVGELVSGVAHELNNPLQSVVGMVELALDATQEPAVRADLETVRREAERAVKIIRSLLAFVRKAPSERILCDLNEIVESTVALRACELSASKIELREEYAPALPVVYANREELQQIVLNLVVNAQDSMTSANGGGVLTIRSCMSGTNAVVEVIDDGPGIPSPTANRIFEPFFTTKVVGEGTGLGLSVSLGIARAHGGSLELVPTAAGARFRLTLPGAGFAGPAPAREAARIES